MPNLAARAWKCGKPFIFSEIRRYWVGAVGAADGCFLVYFAQMWCISTGGIPRLNPEK
jgi:hypothetical protein